MKKTIKLVAKNIGKAVRGIACPKPKRFQMQVEYVPNPDIVIIHTRKKFPKSDTDPIHRFDDKECVGNKHPLIRSISRFKGVLEVSSDNYELRITKARMFGWDEILPKARRALVKYFTDGLELDELRSVLPEPRHRESLGAIIDL